MNTVKTNDLDESLSNLYYVNNKKYIRTLMTCFFLGMFGCHRIINSKLKSGLIMLTSSFIVLITFIVLYVTSISREINELMKTFVILSLIIFVILHLWKTIDLILIITNRFKVSNPKKYLRSSKPFLYGWFSYVVIICLILSNVFLILSFEAISNSINNMYSSVLSDNNTDGYSKYFRDCLDINQEVNIENNTEFFKWIENKLQTNGYDGLYENTMINVSKDFSNPDLMSSITIYNGFKSN